MEANIVPNMITVKQLQEVLGVGKDTAYELVKRKDFPSVKLGRGYKILADELDDWIRKQKRNK